MRQPRYTLQIKLKDGPIGPQAQVIFNFTLWATGKPMCFKLICWDEIPPSFSESLFTTMMAYAYLYGTFPFLASLVIIIFLQNLFILLQESCYFLVFILVYSKVVKCTHCDFKRATILWFFEVEFLSDTPYVKIVHSIWFRVEN